MFKNPSCTRRKNHIHKDNYTFKRICMDKIFASEYSQASDFNNGINVSQESNKEVDSVNHGSQSNFHKLSNSAYYS